MHIKYGYDGSMAGHFFETLNDQWKIEDEDLTPHAEVTTNGDETEIFDADQDLRMTVKKVVWDKLNPSIGPSNRIMEEISRLELGHLRIHPTATPTGMIYTIMLMALEDESARFEPASMYCLFEIFDATSIEEGLKAVASYLELEYEG